MGISDRVAAQAVENLVTQFSSVLDFYRELVQNSIDAGSSQIDVWMEYTPADDPEADGTIAIHVDDWGEGMTEAIIDGQLTKLFSSGKEDDFTKIGKFGIGFVSVFALGPKAVLVHTGRSGEYWEVLFHEDRSFSKTRVDAPVEGTQITLFVAGTAARYEELVAGSRDTLRRWCVHSHVEITFRAASATGESGETESINEPFGVEGDCSVDVAFEDAHVALAFHAVPRFGFYNQGLMLATMTDPHDAVGVGSDRFRHISFKVKSKYLEHTLSRETILRDENYERVVEFLHEAADGPLRSALVDELRELAAAETLDPADLERYEALLGYLAAEPVEALRELENEPLLRGLSGRALGLEQAVEAFRDDGRVFQDSEVTPLVRAVLQQGSPVFAVSGTRTVPPITTLMVAYLSHRVGGRLGRRLGRWIGLLDELDYESVVCRPERVFIAVETEDEPDPVLRGLVRSASHVLEALSLGYREIAIGRVSTPTVPTPMFLVGRRIEPLMALPPPEGFRRRWWRRRPAVLLNGRHPHVQRIVGHGSERPAMAVYALAKCLLLAEDRALARDGELIAQAKKEVDACPPSMR